MTGLDLKKILAKTGKSQAEIAELLGMKRQNLSAILSSADVKTGIIERLCDALDLHPSFFYGGGINASDHSVAINGDGNRANNVDEKLVDVIDRQSKQITQLIDILSKQNQNVQ